MCLSYNNIIIKITIVETGTHPATAPTQQHNIIVQHSTRCNTTLATMMYTRPTAVQ